jgi:hypothetical protein
MGLLIGLAFVADAISGGLFRLARGLERAARKEPVDGKVNDV